MKGDHCNCIAINHSHVAGQCDEPEPPTGAGVCPTCRYASSTPPKIKVYIAGPMTHIPQFNIPAFDAAAASLRGRGFDVVNPVTEDGPVVRAAALASPDGDPQSIAHLGQTHGDFLARDVKIIADGGIEAVYVLDGWERSKGARHETFVAHLNYLPVFCYTCDEAIPLWSLVNAWAGATVLSGKSIAYAPEGHQS